MQARPLGQKALRIGILFVEFSVRIHSWEPVFHIRKIKPQDSIDPHNEKTHRGCSNSPIGGTKYRFAGLFDQGVPIARARHRFVGYFDQKDRMEYRIKHEMPNERAHLPLVDVGRSFFNRSQRYGSGIVQGMCAVGMLEQGTTPRVHAAKDPRVH